MKVINLLLAAMFMVFAFLQINDPDPLIWIVIYGAMVVTCVLAAFNTYYKPGIFVLIGLYLVYSFFYLDGVMEWFAKPDKAMLFDDVMKMKYPYIEESREFLGLMICIIVLVVHLVLSRNARTAA
jgi:hypothetical protein